MRACLREDRRAARLGSADFLYDGRRGHVRDQDRRLNQLGERDGAMGGFAISQRRPGARVVAHRGAAARNQAARQKTHGGVILGVHHGERA